MPQHIALLKIRLPVGLTEEMETPEVVALMVVKVVPETRTVIIMSLVRTVKIL